MLWNFHISSGDIYNGTDYFMTARSMSVRFNSLKPSFIDDDWNGRFVKIGCLHSTPHFPIGCILLLTSLDISRNI